MYTGPVDFAKYICIPPECFNGITLYGSSDSVSQELPSYSLMVSFNCLISFPGTVFTNLHQAVSTRFIG